MTREHVEQAQIYAKEHGDDVIEDDKLEDAFLDGAESRQAEIDGLKISIAMAQDMIYELQKHSK